MAGKNYDLGSSEFEVLKVLWDLGPSTVREVMNEMHDRQRKVAYTTVLTFLTRLEQKGVVASDKSGLAHVFRAKISRERVGRSRAKKLVQQIYDGAAGPLVLQLVRTERLSEEEIDELHRLIERLEANPKRTP